MKKYINISLLFVSLFIVTVMTPSTLFARESNNALDEKLLIDDVTNIKDSKIDDLEIDETKINDSQNEETSSADTINNKMDNSNTSSNHGNENEELTIISPENSQEAKDTLNSLEELNGDVTIEELSDEEVSNFKKTKTISEDNDDVDIKKENENGNENENENKNTDESEEDSIDISKLTPAEIKALGHKLRTVSKDEQKPILNALKKLGKKASPATNEVLASLHEKKTSNDAVDILINIGTESAISGLARLISNSSNKELSNYILENISKLKSNAEYITEELMANFQNKDLKKNIINALSGIQGQRAFYELKELLKSQTESEEIKILTLKGFLKFKNAKLELPLLRRLYRQNLPSDYADELSNAISELEKE